MSLSERIKEFSELFFWRLKFRKGQAFNNAHYAYFFTDFFGLTQEFYHHKSILDIGCGPRGSLEWAIQSSKRTGLDPLADAYKRSFAQQHQMDYVNAYCEQMPFEDESYDVVTSFNALDHVRSLSESCKEMKRVVKSGGYIFLVCDVHSYPTLTEPQRLPWNLAEEQFSEFRVLEERYLERVYKTKFYENLRLNRAKKMPSGEGILYLKLQKN